MYSSEGQTNRLNYSTGSCTGGILKRTERTQAVNKKPTIQWALRSSLLLLLVVRDCHKGSLFMQAVTLLLLLPC